MICSIRFYLVLVTGIFLSVSTVSSADPETDIPKLVRQLGSDQFAERRSASDALQELGKAAFPALSEAAKSGDREVTTRATAILKHHLKSNDQETLDAAQKALQGLAEDSHAVAARLAKQALKPEEPEVEVNPVLRNLRAAQIAQIQIQVQGGNNARQVRVKVANGNKEIKIKEQGREIEIQQAADGSIKMQVTEKKNGKDVVKKYEAKNVDDLKKKHPEAHKIYQQHNRQGIQLGGIRIGGRPAIQRPGRPVPVAPFQRNQQQFEKSKKRLDETIKQYRERIEKAEKEIKASKKAIQDKDGNAQQHEKAIEESTKDRDRHQQQIATLEQAKENLDNIQKRIGDIQKRADQNRADLQKQREELKRRIKLPQGR